MNTIQTEVPKNPVPLNHPALRKHPSKLFVETTTRCNLGCFMCVKQSGECCIAEGDLPAELFAALDPAFPHLEALILNGIGEPLLNPRLEEYIRRARERMPEKGWVGFQSNALLLNEDRARSLVEAGLGRICLSVDAVSPEIFREVREGGEITAVERAMAALEGAKKEFGSSNLEVGVEFVLMRRNFRELPIALRWAAARGARFALVTHVLPYDESHAREAAYETCTDLSIDLFRRWRRKAEDAGVNISRYFQVLWKYSKTPEERKIVQLVEQMKTEATGRGIYLDLKKLFALDVSWLGEVQEVFAEAREIAAEHGMDLRLPEVVLKGDRRCEFIEEGGAFVSWEGGVHPCYFLWHRYNCFASGWTQMVQPRVFGHLAKQGILELWNSDGFREFRSNVLGYDYPSCAGCSLAPCDYVQTEAFEQDCHINKEPCGSCLWCTGLFQCLR
jgi:putative metalloenzyme radical SAM/SPASM domain maturase